MQAPRPISYPTARPTPQTLQCNEAVLGSTPHCAPSSPPPVKVGPHKKEATKIISEGKADRAQDHMGRKG